MKACWGTRPPSRACVSMRYTDGPSCKVNLRKSVLSYLNRAVFVLRDLNRSFLSETPGRRLLKLHDLG